MGAPVNHKRTAKPLPSQELLQKLLDYDPETGFLFWKACPDVPRVPCRAPGTRAFSCKSERGYWRGGLLGRNCMAHRVVWKWHFGTEPEEIDHINGIKGDNRIANLRPASRTDNNRNACIRKTNKSGIQGVYWHRTKRRWIANIRDGQRQIELGGFKDKAEAAEARRQAEIRLGYHPNHGRPANG